MKGNGNTNHYGKKREKNTKHCSNKKKLTDTTKCYVRLEPGTSCMWSEAYTSTPKSRMKIGVAQ